MRMKFLWVFILVSSEPIGFCFMELEQSKFTRKHLINPAKTLFTDGLLIDYFDIFG